MSPFSGGQRRHWNACATDDVGRQLAADYPPSFELPHQPFHSYLKATSTDSNGQFHFRRFRGIEANPSHYDRDVLGSDSMPRLLHEGLEGLSIFQKEWEFRIRLALEYFRHGPDDVADRARSGASPKTRGGRVRLRCSEGASSTSLADSLTQTSQMFAMPFVT